LDRKGAAPAQSPADMPAAAATQPVYTPPVEETSDDLPF
jgi:hypothetical protein